MAIKNKYFTLYLHIMFNKLNLEENLAIQIRQ